MRIGNMIDSFLAPLFPRMAASRSRARLDFAASQIRSEVLEGIRGDIRVGGNYHDAAKRDRTSKDWPGQTVSADGAIIGDSTLMNARARSAVVNDWAGNSLVGSFRRHVVGIGITPRSAARDPETGKQTDVFKQFNRKIDWLYNHWAHRPGLCDSERKKPLAEMDSLTVSELITVGQSFSISCFKPRRGQVGLFIQMFETEQLDWTLTKNTDNGNDIRGGIEIDDSGAEIAFWLFRGKHPLDSFGGKSTRIAAERVWHVMRQGRVRQTHGLTHMSSVIEDIYQLKGYKQAEAVAKRIEACIGLRKRTESWYAPEAGGALGGLGTSLASGENTTDERGNKKIRMEPGMVPDSPDGVYWEYMTPQRPGPMYDLYVDRAVKQIAAGGGSDSSHVLRSFHEGNFSSQRQGSLEHDRETDPIQMNLIVDQQARPRREMFKTYAILQNLVDAPGFFEDPYMMMAYMEDDWQGPPKPWVDPKNQATAVDIALKNGLTDLRAQKNILGGSHLDAIDERSDEQSYAESRTPPVHLPWLYKGEVSQSEQAGDKKDDDDSEKDNDA